MKSNPWLVSMKDIKSIQWLGKIRYKTYSMHGVYERYKAYSMVCMKNMQNIVNYIVSVKNMKSIVYSSMGVDGYINTMKTTFLFKYWFLTSFFKLQVHK